MGLLHKTGGGGNRTRTATVYGNVVETGLEINGLPAIKIKAVHGLGLQGKIVTAFLSVDPKRGGALEKRPNFDPTSLAKMKLEVGSLMALEGCTKSGEDDNIIVEARYPGKMTDKTGIDVERSLLTTPGVAGSPPRAALLSLKGGLVTENVNLQTATASCHQVVDNASASDTAVNIFMEPTFVENGGKPTQALVHRSISFLKQTGEKTEEGKAVWARKTNDEMKSEITEFLTSGKIYVFSKGEDGGAAHLEVSKLFGEPTEELTIESVTLGVVPAENITLSNKEYFKEGHYEGIRHNVSVLGVAVEQGEGKDGQKILRANNKAVLIAGGLSTNGKEVPAGTLSKRLFNQINFLNGTQATAAEAATAEAATAETAEVPSAENSKPAHNIATPAPAATAEPSDDSPFDESGPGM